MDYNSDTSRQTFQMLQRAVTVDMAKLASDQDRPGSGQSHSFADPKGRKFPIHTKSATLLSACYFYGNPGESNKLVEQNLKLAARYWDVEDDLSQIERDLSRIDTQPKFAVDHQIGQDRARHFAWKDSQSLEKAASDFVANRQKFPLEVRRQAAENLVKAGFDMSVQFDPDVEDYLERAMALGLPDRSKTARAISERYSLVSKSPIGRQKLQKLAKIYELLGDDWSYEQTKTAIDALASFDEETGLSGRYERDLALPEESVIGKSLSKAASEIEGTVVLTNGHRVKLADIDWSQVRKFDPQLADEVSGSLEKAAEVLPTWPRPDADTLVELLGL